MANELTLTFSLYFKKSDLEVRREVKGDKVTVSGDAYDARVLEIATGGTTITPASTIGTEGYCFVRNLDATNFLTLGDFEGGSTYGSLIKLKPGECAMFRLDATAVIRGVADTAACLLEIIIIED